MARGKGEVEGEAEAAHRPAQPGLAIARPLHRAELPVLQHQVLVARSRAHRQAAGAGEAPACRSTAKWNHTGGEPMPNLGTPAGSSRSRPSRCRASACSAPSAAAAVLQQHGKPGARGSAASAEPACASAASTRKNPSSSRPITRCAGAGRTRMGPAPHPVRWRARWSLQAPIFGFRSLLVMPAAQSASFATRPRLRDNRWRACCRILGERAPACTGHGTTACRGTMLRETHRALPAGAPGDHHGQTCTLHRHQRLPRHQQRPAAAVSTMPRATGAPSCRGAASRSRRCSTPRPPAPR